MKSNWIKSLGSSQVYKPYKEIAKKTASKTKEERIEKRKQWIEQNQELAEILIKKRLKKYFEMIKTNNTKG